MIGDEFTTLFRDGAKVHIETGDFLIGLKKDERIAFRKAILEKVTKAGWELITPAPFKHHFLTNVKNPNFQKMLTSSQNQEDEDDFLDLSSL